MDRLDGPAYNSTAYGYSPYIGLRPKHGGGVHRVEE